MKTEIYKYNGENYYSVIAVRKAISRATGMCFGSPKTPEEWKALGVDYEVIIEPDPEPIPPTPEEIERRRLDEAKEKRREAVENIKVDVDGMTFDGDEKAQGRMTRAITASDITGVTETTWVLADNTVATVTLAQLKQALSKSMIAMGELWTKPYQEMTNA